MFEEKKELDFNKVEEMPQKQEMDFNSPDQAPKSVEKDFNLSSQPKQPVQTQPMSKQVNKEPDYQGTINKLNQEHNLTADKGFKLSKTNDPAYKGVNILHPTGRGMTPNELKYAMEKGTLKGYEQLANQREQAMRKGMFKTEKPVSPKGSLNMPKTTPPTQNQLNKEVTSMFKNREDAERWLNAPEQKNLSPKDVANVRSRIDKAFPQVKQKEDLRNDIFDEDYHRAYGVPTFRDENDVKKLVDIVEKGMSRGDEASIDVSNNAMERLEELVKFSPEEQDKMASGTGEEIMNILRSKVSGEKPNIEEISDQELYEELVDNKYWYENARSEEEVAKWLSERMKISPERAFAVVKKYHRG